jgi:mono/diheme cytochrome c family protein
MMRTVSIAFAAGAGLLSMAVLAQPVSIELPFGETPAELAGPDAEVVVANCSGCHSLDYVTTQPRGKGEQFWRDSVAKMITVYKAPLTPERADAVAAVLARKFG